MQLDDFFTETFGFELEVMVCAEEANKVAACLIVLLLES